MKLLRQVEGLNKIVNIVLKVSKTCLLLISSFGLYFGGGRGGGKEAACSWPLLLLRDCQSQEMMFACGTSAEYLINSSI